MAIANQKILIIGGSSGIGLATAQAAAEAGAHLIIASRSQQKLVQAKQTFSKEIETYQLDISNEDEVRKFAATIGMVDHLVVAGSAIQAGPFKDFDTAAARTVMDSKFWGAYIAARYINVASTGSITLFSGAFSQRPAVGYAALAAVNSAVEGLGRALALELAPVRVNVISPGLIATPAYDGMPADMREGYFQHVANGLPVKRIGKPEDVAETVLYLMNNGYTTGTIIDINGGGLLV